MLLLSQKSELEMFAELVPINIELPNSEKTLNFVLENKFTDDHMIKLVVEDSQEKLAIFVTESWHNCNNSSEN
jgi:hypothetical protein